ncbi:hypothetical protein F4808DRAFT_468404 [Astrocystis sublimbata]|nr:hypothetical protein F4808DRAFT_468404 [Astrocystis sublimbata]
MLNPESILEDDTESATNRIYNALRTFLADPPSEDPDYPFLLHYISLAAEKRKTSMVGYFRQQMAHLAMQKPIDRKDKSAKTRQLKYYRWLALGLKNESWPFPTMKPGGAASTVRIAGLANPTSCAFCHKPGANYRCPTCNIQDNKYVVNKTAYCNKKCLEEHHDTHKPICEGRVMVYRTAQMLGFIFMAMQDATYVYPIGKSFLKNGIIYLIDGDWDRAGMTGRSVFFPFPKHQVDSAETHRALLYWGQCKELNLSLYPLIRYMFKQICGNVELIFISPKNVLRPICQLTKGRAFNLCLHRHICLGLTLASGEKYIIDLTGASFGWHEVLTPWETWMDLRAGRWESDPFRPATGDLKEYISNNTLDSFQQEVRIMLLKTLVHELNGLLRANNCQSFDKLVKLPEPEWRRAEGEIVQMVQNQIYLRVTCEYHKTAYRLYFTPPPEFALHIAKRDAAAYKKVWMSGKEYDQLRMAWGERCEKYLKQRTAEIVINM